MARKYKYILQKGLAFSEDGDMKRLRELAKEGWLLKEVTILKYKLERGEAKDIIYQMDYCNTKDKDEYLQMFEHTSWECVCSYGGIYFFSAPVGTTPIYTDRDSYADKYKFVKGIYEKALIISFFGLLIASLVNIYDKRALENKLLETLITVLGALSSGIFVASLMTTVALFFRTRKGKKKFKY